MWDRINFVVLNQRVKETLVSPSRSDLLAQRVDLLEERMPTALPPEQEPTTPKLSLFPIEPGG
ncbi:MAG: hypothetical protein PVJ76_09060 [Gemmatimonadota bacterium]